MHSLSVVNELEWQPCGWLQVVHEGRRLVGGHSVSHAAAGAVCEAEGAEGWVEEQGRSQEPCCAVAAAQAAPAARQPHPAPGLQRQLHWHRVCAHAALPVLLLVGSCIDIPQMKLALAGLSDALLPAVWCSAWCELHAYRSCWPRILMLHTCDRVPPSVPMPLSSGEYYLLQSKRGHVRCRYFHTIPLLLWSTRLPTAVRLSLWLCIEVIFNVYPSTAQSSMALVGCHLIILCALALFPTRFYGSIEKQRAAWVAQLQIRIS